VRAARVFISPEVAGAPIYSHPGGGGGGQTRAFPPLQGSPHLKVLCRPQIVRRCAGLGSIGTFCQRISRPFCPFYSDASVSDDGVGSPMTCMISTMRQVLKTVKREVKAEKISGSIVQSPNPLLHSLTDQARRSIDGNPLAQLSSLTSLSRHHNHQDIGDR
jgi:hypothetical protein